MSALRAVGLTKVFGGFTANDRVTFSVARGARHALIGPNGAGKTTLVNLLSGTLEPTRGDVFLGDEPVTPLEPHERVRRGLTRTFQVTQLFPGLTALESVALAVCERTGAAWRWFTPVARCEAEIAEARRILASLRLEPVAHVPTRELPYGQQRLLEIAVALATRPKVLLLDEPAAGIPRGETAQVLAVLAALPRDVTLLFIEHDMDVVFRFAERITVMVGGRVLMEGTPDEVSADARVREVYLGEGERHG